MRLFALLASLTLFLCTASAAAQDVQAVPDTESAANPLAELKAELTKSLAAAGVPFTDEQDTAITLMMEERRRASEELFGNLMDFRGGPTQGQEEDRLRSAIDWMRAEFLRLLTGYLTTEQAAAWSTHQTAGRTAPGPLERPRAPRRQETQFVRINSNAFTAENPGFGGGGGGGGGNFQGGGNQQGTEVIQRGGAGAWHGNSQFLLKDDALNARNAFAGNKPPYQERRLSIDVSGPSIPGRLTTAVQFSQTEAKNVTAVRATLPDGIYALGITRPNTFRNILTRNTVQVAESHSVRLFARRAAETSKDQGIGGFTLPERRSDNFRRQWNTGVFAFSALSPRTLLEWRFQLNGNSSETVPFSEAVRINVLDAFNGGGAQNRSEDNNRTYEFGNLYTRMGETLTIKAGVEGAYRIEQAYSTNNFVGTFTFSSLDAYVGGTPLTYRVTRGNPLLETRQLEASSFVQTDLKVNSRLTVMAGVRYDAQTNLEDFNNLAPRASFAYSPGRGLVVRGGGGVFYNRLSVGMVDDQRRFDGTRQFELVVDNPAYPDPFAAGTLRQTFPSVRVTDPDLAAPVIAVGMLSVERTFFSNLLFSATYDVQRERNRFRTRNLNAPYDSLAPTLRACAVDTPSDACVRPDPSRGNVVNLESTGREVRHNVRLSGRKRFSIFNASLNYQLQRAFGDVQGQVGALATDSYDLRADWGPAPFPRHQVSSSVNAQLPLGIFLTGTMSGNSGRYYTITTGRDDNRDSNVTDRPAGVGPNTLRGPRYLNFDFNVSKAVFFGRAPGATSGGMNVNVFANMTNAFNHVHYGTPSGVMTSPNFGRSTSASDPREIEAGIRFQF